MKYNFLKTHTKEKWQRIGTHKRSGVVVPLFSIYSDKSTGVGEILDIKYIVDWCKKTGMSIIQLLPLNELGPDNAPYNAISTFALEPMYLKLNELKGVDQNGFQDEIQKLKIKYRSNRSRVNYNIKNEKIDLLWRIFKNIDITKNKKYNNFVKHNKYWLKDFALFKIISESEGTQLWDKWNKKLSAHYKIELDKVYSANREKFDFHYWIQWQLYEQMKDLKKYANVNGVLIMGDLPFLVSRYSADVWSHQNYFKLNLAAGAPPDIYFAQGQLWGMPPYHWENIKKNKYIYLKKRLLYAQNFYNLYRIDHFIGLFRVWTVELGTGHVNAALHGKFDPENENLWEKHGKKIIDKMLSFTDMLPCAEDLGSVPACSYKTLTEYGIPGVDFQRYLKDKNDNFIEPKKYRPNSAAVISTHDSTFFFNWWGYEAGKSEQNKFMKYLYGRSQKKNIPASTSFIKKCLERINESESIFSIQLIQEYLSLDEKLLKKMNKWNYRINSPGTFSNKNWVIRLPIGVEKLGDLKINTLIYEINKKSGRLF